MSEANFTIRANTDQGRVEFNCTGDNTELYLFSPRFQEVNHLFHRYDDTDRRLGAFVWKTILGEEEFNQVASYMHESGEYPIYYRPEPLDTDMEQYLHSQSGDIDTWTGESE